MKNFIMQTKFLWLFAIVFFSIEWKMSSAEDEVIVDDICGRKSYTESSGIIRFPESHYVLLTNFSCNYRIDVGEDNLVSLRFLYFDLPTYLDFCNLNWITISCLRNDISEVVTRRSPQLCGQTRWSSALMLTDCPVVSLDFATDYHLVLDDKGFILRYEIAPTVRSNFSDANEVPEIECGDTLFTNQSGVITLPNFPNITRVKVNCTYTISPSEPDILMSSLTLDVSYFDLLTLTDESDECVQDRLQIVCTDDNGQHAGPSRCQRFSSDQLSSPKYFGCFKLKITLQSDSFDPREIRRIAYSMIIADVDDEDEDEEEEIDYDYHGSDFDRGRSTICGNSTYVGPTGHVSSPHFPLAHPHGLNCPYRIIVGRKKDLYLKFLAFDLEGDSSSSYCSFDWITISCVVNRTAFPNHLFAKRLCGQIQLSSELRYSNCSSVMIHFISDGSVAKGGFRIRYSITAKDSRNFTEIDCGRTEFDTSDGVMILPRNPTGYLTRVNCVYTVDANSSSVFTLNTTSFNWTRIRQQIGMCIQFSCEGERAWNLNSCRDYLYSWNQEIAFYKCQKMRLTFNSEFFDFQDSYRIPFKVISADQICGNTSFSASNGTISFPHLGTSYPPATNCTYSIVGGINTTVSISFFKSSFQYPDSRYCYDKITMICLQSPNWNPYANKRFCSQLKWPPVIRFFNCSTLLIAFSSGYNINTAGFRLNYSVSMEDNPDVAENISEFRCGSMISYTHYSGAFSLSTQAEAPLVTINCSYNINLQNINKGVISIDFRQISTAFDHSDDCGHGNFTIACASGSANAEINSTKFLTYCGNTLPNTLTDFTFSGCNSIQLSLRSSAYHAQDYRSVSYRIANIDCGNTSFDGPSGDVISPRFPLPYPNGLRCFYSIEVGDSGAVDLRFLTFELQGISRDGSERSSFSENSDYRFGNEHSSSWYNTYDSCSNDWLIIRCLVNGSQVIYNDNQYLNRNLCGTKSTGTRLIGCQTVRLEFYTGQSTYGSRARGFKIHYDMENVSNPGCGIEHFVRPSGNITSPGFPGLYPNGMNCTYVITAGQNRSVMLQFVAFSLQHGYHHYWGGISQDDCERDWLQINCVSVDSTSMNRSENKKYCGTQRPFTTLSRGCEYMILNFFSDSSASYSGFKIQYTVFPDGEECGNTVFSNSTGIIASPGFPSNYPHRINCTYYIQVGNLSSLSLQFHTFVIGYQLPQYSYRSQLCTNDWIQITCFSRDSADSLVTSQYVNKKLCGFKYSFNAILKRCSLYALEFYSSGIYSKRGFKISYTISSIRDECGKQLYSNSSGVITSPGFPVYYRYNLDCVYNIEVGSNNSLSLNFRSFDIGYSYYSTTCTSDWLQIVCLSRDSDDSLEANENLNKKFCGIKYGFNTTVTGCNRVAIQFVTAETYTRRGFQVDYSISKRTYCGYPSTSFTDTNGVIASPSLVMALRPPNISCTYLISAQKISTISLTISAIQTQSQCFSNWLTIGCLNAGRFFSYSMTSCNDKYLMDDVVFPSCSLVQLRYRSSSYYETHYVIKYRIKSAEDVCGSTSFTEPSGNIAFPEFSPNYAAEFNCSYSISVGVYDVISIELSSSVDAVRENAFCPDDWIAIFCRDENPTGGYKVTHRNCIQSDDQTSFSFMNCSVVDIIFHSGNVDSGRYFKMSYALRFRQDTNETSVTTTASSMTKIICPKDCLVYSNETVCRCAIDPSGQKATESPPIVSRKWRFVGSASFGVLIAFVVLLVFVSLVLIVLWLRRPNRKSPEDERTLTADDAEHENPDSRTNNTWRERRNRSSFFPFRSQNNNGNQGGLKGYVPLESMASKPAMTPRTSSQENIIQSMAIPFNDEIINQE